MQSNVRYPRADSHECRFSVGRFAFNLTDSATSDECLPRIIKALLPFQYLYFVFGNVL